MSPMLMDKNFLKLYLVWWLYEHFSCVKCKCRATTAVYSSIMKTMQWSNGLILNRSGFYQGYASVLDSHILKHWPDHARLCSTADLTEWESILQRVLKFKWDVLAFPAISIRWNKCQLMTSPGYPWALLYAKNIHENCNRGEQSITFFELNLLLC